MTGTADLTWRQHLSTAELSTAFDPGGRAVIVSAHPDDEVIALGAWLSGQVGRDLLFVTATDGESSHPNSPTITPEELRARRPGELLDALTALGLRDPRVERLGLRDGDLPLDRQALTTALTPLLAEASLIVTPYERDGHGDHDVVGDVVREVAPSAAVIWRYPVWLWEWTNPAHDEVWLDRAAILPSSAAAYTAKAEALRAFRTQVEPLSPHPADQQVVTSFLLHHALGAPEVVIT